MEIYTDGSCRANGKVGANGGFGVVVVDDDNIVRTYREDEIGTTNNRMEIKAILWAFLNYGVKPDDEWENDIPIVYSDSSYCVNTFNDWMWGWAKKGWIKSDKKKPENLDLITQYYDHWLDGYRIDLRKIKGHAGYEYNELADQLATGEVKEIIHG